MSAQYSLPLPPFKALKEVGVLKIDNREMVDLPWETGETTTFTDSLSFNTDLPNGVPLERNSRV